MADLRPFRALRPVADRAASVLAPPYDVVDVAEARALAAGNPDSFLHVSRPEIDLPDGLPSDDPAVHARAGRALRGLVDRGVLVLDDDPSYAVYRLTREGRTQTGLVAAVAVADYRAGRVATHEQTRRNKEDDRVHHLEALGAHDEPVFLLAAPGDTAWGEVVHDLDGVVDAPADSDVTDPAGVRHELWFVTDPDVVGRVTAAAAAVPVLYVADGHHRSAAADRVAGDLTADGDERRRELPVVVFPGEELTVLPYNRVVADLGGRSPQQWLAALGEVAGAELRPVAEGEDPAPRRPGEAAVRVDGRWWRLPLATTTSGGDGGTDGEHPAYEEPATGQDPVAALDVSLLQDRVLGPLLGITDPRGDERIGFVGGVRGAAELERLVDEGTWAAAFLLHPTGVDDLVAVAGSGRDMPPKSTWFEPKLGSGLFVHPFSAAYD